MRPNTSRRRTPLWLQVSVLVMAYECLQSFQSQHRNSHDSWSATIIPGANAINLASSGLQTGPKAAPYYAGGMAYDPLSHLVYITGATFMQQDDTTVSPTSNCFVSILRAPSVATKDQFQLIQEQEIGTAAANEACFGITINPRIPNDDPSNDPSNDPNGNANNGPIGATQDSQVPTTQSAYILGTSEEGGVLTDLRNKGSDKVTQYGTILNLGFSGSGQGRLYGGHLLHGSPVSYPVAAVADRSAATETTTKYVYVVSMTSESNKISAHYTRDVDDETQYPNLTRGGPTPKFGTDFELLVERMQVEETRIDNGDTNEIETLLPTWRKPLATAKSSVLVSGMIQSSLGSNALILAGSAKGASPLIGPTPDGLSPDRWSGFLLLLDPNDGTKIQSQRFATTDDEHVEILGICNRDGNGYTSTAPSANDIGDFVYLVGATSGTMENSGKTHPPTENQVDAAVIKIKVSTLEVEWVQQFRAADSNTPTSQETDLIETFAVDCVVSNDGSTVFVGGNVENDMYMVDSDVTDSAGWDDVWIASLQTADGNLNWMKQMGTSWTDRLARGGALMVDENDHVIVYGDTTGGFYRNRDEGEPLVKIDKFPEDNTYISDIFLFTIDANGNYLKVTEQTGTEGQNHHDTPTQPPIILATDPPIAAPTDTSDDANNNSSNNNTSDGDDEVPTARYRFMVVAFVFASILACVAFMCARRSQQEKDSVTERSHVFAYLQSFDVEDVDLRHSATGGWHGTYVNNLAHGVNKADPNDVERLGQRYETSPLTHSSVVRDSLFMDVDSRPSLGGTSSEDDLDNDIDISIDPDLDDDDDASAGYDSLVGAYNDLQPRSYRDRKASLSKDKPWGKDIV